MASKTNDYIGSFADDATADAFLTGLSYPKIVGLYYLNSTTSLLRFWDGTQWAELGSASSPNWASVLSSGNTSGGSDPTISLGDTLEAIGDVNVQNGATLSLASGGTLSALSGSTYTGAAGSTMNLAGTVNVQSGGDFNVQSGGGIDIQSGGDLSVESGGTLSISDITDTTFTGTPTADTHAVNKAYVDSIAAGLDWKDSVRVATTAAGTLATDFENGDTIDGVVLATGDRILIKDQASGVENGIYTVNASGAPTRATDLDTGSSAAGAATFIEEGTTNADTAWVCTNNTGSDVVGTDALNFTQFAGTNTFTGGDGISIAANVISVDLATVSGLEFTGGELRIDVVSTDRLSISAGGLDVVGVPSLFEIGGVATSANVTSANLGTLTAGVASEASSLHIHDSRYYTESELGSTTPASEGALLIGTDTKTNLANATTVEAALTELNTRNPPTRSTGAGNPNSGAGTSGVEGDIYVDTTNDIAYMNVTGAATGWVVIG